MKILRVCLLSSSIVLSACSGARQISRSGAGAFEVSITPRNDGLATAWYDNRDGNAEIYLRFLDAGGRPRSAEFRLTDDPAYSYEPDAAAVGDAVAVGWYEMRIDGGYRSRLGLFDESGRPLWIRNISNPDRYGRNVVVRAMNDEVFAGWIERDPDGTTDIWVGWWSLDGAPTVPRRRVAEAGPTTWNLNAVEARNGEVWIVSDGNAGTASDELLLIRAGQNPDSDVVRLTADDGFDSKYPDLAFGPNRVALTWWDTKDGNEEVYLFVGSPESLQEGVEARATRVTRTPGESIGAYLAWSGSRLGLAWNDDTEGQDEIYFQEFDLEGRPIASAVRLTRNRTQSLIPAIRGWREGFALAWNEHMPVSDQSHSGGRSEIVFRIVP